MKEKFLHYLWRYKLLLHSKLESSQREKISVINSGVYNSNSGPDFLNAKIEIDGQLWYGNIEIHVKASDWYLHCHENDVNYDAVILHVVWENDANIYMKNNRPIPTLELKNKIHSDIINNYSALYACNLNWIPCENQIGQIDSFLIDNWLERLFFERLEEKLMFIVQLLEDSKNDYEAVLFQMLAKNFGLKVNSEAFLRLSKSFDFKIIRKTSDNELALFALLFGQAGFLQDDVPDNYFKSLKQEYHYLRHKFKLRSISKNHFQFFRMRPNNFPTIRIAQLGALYIRHQNLFSELLNKTTIESIYTFFTVELNSFWNTHYTFEKESKFSLKKLSRNFIDLLIINTIIPLKFVYYKKRGEFIDEEILNLVRSMKSEKNSIISQFENIKIQSDNALKSQALLQLKNNYCDDKKCFECAIGDKLIRFNNSSYGT
ncbi:hypothetical protein BTO06_03355 [Tenacibaculum sp. SZ-18]|uniref:DUF2851 family protein n=1 Tax=Tenacibaculum sp. SZ-18 TaxID=754423 RepID=UPI000C2D68D2|nr:DUF2851 family protein [Tenacibaculum sp. SZ-18]AUC14242.1 hypothetical protein BTO06_03355 [Tenacibaculum sp. SZ-18]